MKAELYRIALTNADGPALQAIRRHQPERDSGKRSRATCNARSTKRFRIGAKPGPLAGIPVRRGRLDRTSAGLPTSARLDRARGQTARPADATIVAKLQGGRGDHPRRHEHDRARRHVRRPRTCPQGYSSLGGQVLLASDTNKNRRWILRRLGGWPSRRAWRRWPSAWRHRPKRAADRAGRQRRRRRAEADRRAGQPHGYPAGREVAGLAGPDRPDRQRRRNGARRDRRVRTRATRRRRVSRDRCRTTRRASRRRRSAARRSRSSRDAHDAAALHGSGRRARRRWARRRPWSTPGDRARRAPSIIPFEFHQRPQRIPRAIRRASEGSKVAKSLQQIIEYNEARTRSRALKFGQGGLLAAEAVETTNPATKATYEENLAKGQTEDRETISKAPRRRLLGDHGPAGKPARRRRRSRRLSGADGARRVRCPEQLDRRRPGRRRLHRHRVQRGTAARRTATRSNRGRRRARADRPTWSRPCIRTPSLSGAPSETNQSMFRCVPGSAFFKPYDCNPGEVENPLPVLTGFPFPGFPF